MHIDSKKMLREVVKKKEIYEDVSFLVPQALDYYDVISDAQSVIPYATVGIIIDSANLIKNITDIVADRKNVTKLEKVRKEFGESVLLGEIQKINKKNSKRSIKDMSLNITRCFGDILCFAFLTWIYGESAKVSATVAEVLIEWSKRIRQMGRDRAKKNGGNSIYAKIFNMEKSTSNKIKKKCKVIEMLDVELMKYLDIIDIETKNKELKKLELYVRILSEYKSSFGVRKEWNEILEGRLTDKNLDKVAMSNLRILEEGSIPFMTSFVDMWQFQRFVLMLEFTNEIKKSINNISDRYTLKGRLKDIKLNAQDRDELELVSFLIRYNRGRLKRFTSSMMVLGSNIVGELGEFVAYFKDTVFEIIGIFIRTGGVVLREGVYYRSKRGRHRKRKDKKIIKYADYMLNMIKSVESLSLDYKVFHERVTKVDVYLKTIDLNWRSVVKKDAHVLKTILINALST